MLGIVVVVYKSFDETVKFIKQEIPKIKIPYKLVIVNNAATIVESRKLAEYCNAILVDVDKKININNNIFLITTEDNLGYAKGNNLGVNFLDKNFSIKHLLFSNNDIVFKNDDICENLLKLLDSKEDVAAIGPRVLGLDGKEQSPHYSEIPFLRYFMWNVFPFLRGKFHLLKKKAITNNDMIQVGGYSYWVSGCFFIVDAKDFFNVNMFDPETFLYGEEKILSERLKRINKKVYYHPFDEVIHEDGATTTNTFTSKKIKSLIFNSEIYYYRVYKSVPSIFIFLLKAIKFLRK